MTKPNKEYQRDHRQRRAAERSRMIDALYSIRDHLVAPTIPDKHLLRRIVTEALPNPHTNEKERS